MALDIVQAYNLTENCHLYAKAEPAFYNLIRNEQKLGPLKKHENIWKILAVIWLLFYTTRYLIKIYCEVYMCCDILQRRFTQNEYWFQIKVLVIHDWQINLFTTFTKPLYPFLLQYYLVYLAWYYFSTCSGQ